MEGGDIPRALANHHRLPRLFALIDALFGGTNGTVIRIQQRSLSNHSRSNGSRYNIHHKTGDGKRHLSTLVQAFWAVARCRCSHPVVMTYLKHLGPKSKMSTKHRPVTLMQLRTELESASTGVSGCLLPLPLLLSLEPVNTLLSTNWVTLMMRFSSFFSPNVNKKKHSMPTVFIVSCANARSRQ